MKGFIKLLKYNEMTGIRIIFMSSLTIKLNDPIIFLKKHFSKVFTNVDCIQSAIGNLLYRMF